MIVILTRSSETQYSSFTAHWWVIAQCAQNKKVTLYRRYDYVHDSDNAFMHLNLITYGAANLKTATALADPPPSPPLPDEEEQRGESLRRGRGICGNPLSEIYDRRGGGRRDGVGDRNP
ncbi:hypothetical protein CDAR_279011 [Caerostris darwini]|uniref:Uncharacterized protein n=1 Tax=Caerostris darwini TaxID=1538125 RepID=A0AAV4WQ72_9ARAC|nr:hypothetical protein CDAR_279011 [Caerostris darwini]